MNKSETERVAMLALMPGIEYAVSFFERSLGELRSELHAIYEKIRGNGAIPPAPIGFNACALHAHPDQGGSNDRMRVLTEARGAAINYGGPMAPATDEDWIDAHEGARRFGLGAAGFQNWARIHKVESKPTGTITRGQARMLYNARDFIAKRANKGRRGAYKKRKQPQLAGARQPAVPVVKTAAKRKEKGATDPPMIDGWYTTIGAARKLGITSSAAKSRLTKRKDTIRTRQVALAGVRNAGVKRVVIHPEDIDKLKLEQEA